MTAEQQARLSDIQAGPWRERSMTARTLLTTLTPEQTRRYLRTHFGDRISGFELEFRESFDQILEEIQLLELAVACGFLPLEVVRPAAEAEFRTALSSEAARAYLKIYDFLPVRFLAARLGIELGIGDVHPPEIEARASVRYAMFLSTHYEFIASAAIRRFTRLIDDVHWGRFGARFFIEQLASSPASLSAGELEIFHQACAGLVEFVDDLGDFFLPVPDGERGYFGLVYGYWLSHFFGLRRMEVSYERRGINFEDVEFSQALSPPDLDPGVAETEARRFRERVQALRAVWDETKRMIEQPIQAIDEVQRGATHPSSESSPSMTAAFSVREREVLHGIAAGMSAKEIADALSISARTVEFCKYKIRQKLGIHDTASLVRYAIRQGFIQP